MDKEKEIEEMALLLVNDILLGHTAEETAEHFVNASYGNVEQAVKEFASNIIDLLGEMGMERSSEYNDGYDDGVADCITNIKSRLTELYGADE